LFSSEMSHFKVEKEGIFFFKGALYHNVRVGSLARDFPSVAEKLGIRIPEVKDVWNSYFSVCMSSVQEKRDVLVNPKIRIIFPKIEFNIKKPIINSIPRKNLPQMLFHSASEKIVEVKFLYNLVPVGSIDKKEFAEERFGTMREFVEKSEILSSEEIIASAGNCLDKFFVT